MELPETMEFTSKRFPEVSVTIRPPTFGMRLDLARKLLTAKNQVEDLETCESLWNAMVVGCRGITIGGRAVTPSRIFIDGPEELVFEIFVELKRIFGALPTQTLTEDEILLRLARDEVAAIEERIRVRKAAMKEPPASSGVQ
jgi:hypothetical protein